MSTVFIGIELALLLLGVGFLVRSLNPIKRLILELPQGRLARRWKTLSLLILSFLIAYLVFAYDIVIHQKPYSMTFFLITIVLFLGGIFVFLVGQLALHTISTIKHLSVLEQESITDGLTGLKNRRYFDQRIAEEVALSKRYKLPLSLILIDVDHFKKINDMYGHTVGDSVLKRLAALVSELVRDSDVVARYGGEEIVIITPNTTKQAAALLAERLRSVIEQTTVATVGATQEIVQVTISLGVCSLSHVITDKVALLEETDQALYSAKKFGRNKVVVSNW